MTRHALISGASIAGPAVAHRLAANGWRTTVLERAPRLRDEGHNVDIRGAAREVVRLMGIEDDVRAANTTEVGMRFVRADGSVAAAFPQSGGTDGPTAELEILRGELGRILVEHTPDTDYRFGTRIAALDDHGDHVTATLDDGGTIDADLVVIAEGLRSRTRELVLPTALNELGMYGAYLTIPRLPSDDRWWNWHHATLGRAVHLRPDNVGTTRAMLTFMSDVRGLAELGRAELVTILRRTFADVGYAAARILDELDDAPMYFDAVGQHHTPAWSTGRVALLGDAAHCNATFGGLGTSLALIGAHVLAGEVNGADDVPAGLRRYQRSMQPYVDAAPQVRRGVLAAMNPLTSLGIRALHASAGLAASPVARRVGGLLGRNLVRVAAEEVSLPEYPTPQAPLRT